MCADSLSSMLRTENFSSVKLTPSWCISEKILAVRAGSDSIISAKSESEDWNRKSLEKHCAATDGKIESESSWRITSSTWEATVGSVGLSDI